MYLKRKIDLMLMAWKASDNRRPLVIQGARQVGKTASVLHFAEKNYESVVAINFAEESKYKSIADKGYSAADVIGMISLLNPSHRFVPGKTLIFFDEIQEFPEIATALKFLCLDGRFDVICSGSLLGVQYHRVASFSMGYKEDHELRSMDFEEFLWARGYGDDLSAMMLERMLEAKPFSPGELERLEELFMDYVILGGMPSVVASFLEVGHFGGSLKLQRQLLREYRDDIRKYSEGLDQSRVTAALESVPMQLAKQNKKFQYSKIAPGARGRDYRGCVEWLRDAGIVNLCHCLNYPELPLKGNALSNAFKVYVADTGLLVAMLDDEAQDDLRANRNLGIYKGALYENIAAEALAKSGYPLYYYCKDNSTLEEDFFVRDATNLYPVEVKSTNGRSKSLRTLLDSEKYPDIREGIKFASANIGRAGKITTFPYCCLFLLRKYLQERSRRTQSPAVRSPNAIS